MLPASAGSDGYLSFQTPLWNPYRAVNRTVAPPRFATVKQPIRRCASSFDHLVGALLEEQRYVEAERCGDFQIDRQEKRGKRTVRETRSAGYRALHALS